MLLNRYSLDYSGLAPLPNPCKCLPVGPLLLFDVVGLLTPVLVLAVIYQYRRYRTLKGDLSMVRERKDFYQLKKATGEEPMPEAQLVESEPAGAADTAGRRKKKKAHKARSTAKVEVETEVELDAGPETEVVSEGPDGSSKKRIAREEVTSVSFSASMQRLCISTNFCVSLLSR